MGIDIYARWRKQSKEEKEAQYTGFSVVSGNAGYLREAYHGAPYVTKYLVQEAFLHEGDDNVKIPASVMRQRLPVAVLMALYRNEKLYGKGKPDPSKVDEKNIGKVLQGVFDKMSDESHVEFAINLTDTEVNYGKMLIENNLLPDYAQTFVEFVELCEAKERELGEPCEISASA